MRMERWRSAACSTGATGRTPSGSSADRSRSIRSSPACALSSPSFSPRSARTTIHRRGASRAGPRPAVAARQHERRLGVLLRRPPGGGDRRAAASRAISPRSERRRAAQRDDRVLRAARQIRGRGANGSMGHHCFGVPVDGEALLAAWRAGGAPAYWLERLAALDRVSAAITPMVHYNYACVLTQLGRHDDAMAHLTSLVDSQQGSVVFLAVEPALAPLRDRGRISRPCSRGLGCPVRPRLQHRVKRRHDRHRHAGARRAPHDRALQLLDLDALSLRQIDQQRRPHRPRECRRRTRRCAPRCPVATGTPSARASRSISRQPSRNRSRI